MTATQPFFGTRLPLQSQVLSTVDEEVDLLDFDTLLELNLDEEAKTLPADLKEKEITVVKPDAAKNSALSIFAKYTLMIAATSLADMALTHKIAEYATKSLGFCFGNFFSKAGIGFLWSLENSIARLNNTISKVFGNNLSSTIVIPAFLEEVEFRWFVQDVVLKKLPQKIIEQISPKMAYLVDSLPAKVSRIFAAATIFALIHAHALGCETGGGMYQFVGGLLYGTIYELSDSMMHTVNAHILYNFFDKMRALL